MEQERGSADTVQPPAGSMQEQRDQQDGQAAAPYSYLVTYNVSKKHNLDSYVEFCHYNTLEECCRDLKQNKGCTIVGVEIIDGARPVHCFPFSGNTAFMLGNEGQGLNEKQLALCDSFVYIPQYGAGTASLNVAVAASIILHHFAMWAGYRERQREGHKFAVDERPQRTAPRGHVPLTPEEQAVERQRRQQSAQDTEADPAQLPELFE